MSYLAQILQQASQRGGLSDNEFNAIFENFLSKEERPSYNLGSNAPIQKRQQIGLKPYSNVIGTGMNTTQFGRKPNSGPSPMDNLMASWKYDTNMGSEQTRMLAEQDMDFNDGLFSFFN
jgi:hypothetical protein